MTEINQIYKCEICGNIVEVVHNGAGELVCCNQPMKLQKEKTEDEGKEKHVPVLEGNTVKVGSIPHPMEENHYIEWIEIIDNGKVYKKFLKPGDAPEAQPKAEISDKAILRAYCNVHGLWKNKEKI